MHNYSYTQDYIDFLGNGFWQDYASTFGDIFEADFYGFKELETKSITLNYLITPDTNKFITLLSQIQYNLNELGITANIRGTNQTLTPDNDPNTYDILYDVNDDSLFEMALEAKKPQNGPQPV